MNDSDSSHRPLQVLYTISDVSCSSSHQPESYRLLMGLSFKGDGQGKACGRTWPLKLFPLASLSKLGLVCRRIQFPVEGSMEGGGTACAECVTAIAPGHAGIRTSGAEASFEAQHISCCLHAPEIKDCKSKPGSQPKYQKTVMVHMCIIWCLICMHCLCILIPAFQTMLSHPWSHQQMDYICPNESHSFSLLRFFPPNCWMQLLPRPLPYALFALNAEIFFHKLVTVSVTLQAAWTWASSDLESLCSNEHNQHFRAHGTGWRLPGLEHRSCGFLPTQASQLFITVYKGHIWIGTSFRHVWECKWRPLLTWTQTSLSKTSLQKASHLTMQFSAPFIL